MRNRKRPIHKTSTKPTIAPVTAPPNIRVPVSTLCPLAPMANPIALPVATPMNAFVSSLCSSRTCRTSLRWNERVKVLGPQVFGLHTNVVSVALSKSQRWRSLALTEIGVPGGKDFTVSRSPTDARATEVSAKNTHRAQHSLKIFATIMSDTSSSRTRYLATTVFGFPSRKTAAASRCNGLEVRRPRFQYSL